MQASRSVAISGIGAVTGFGIGVQPLWKGCLNEQTLLAEGLGKVPTALVGELNALAPEESNNAVFLFALAAIQEAMQMAGWEKLNPDDGLILATTTGQIPLWDRLFINILTTEPSSNRQQEFKTFQQQQLLGSLLEKISVKLDFTGPSMVVTSACSASTQAMAIAQSWINSGRVKRCLVGGSEVLCDLTVNGFSALQLLTKGECRPFDATRTGICLSEGAAFLCLEKSSSQTLAWLSGSGMSQDSYHMTAPHPEGEGGLRALKRALEMAELTPQEISWIHAHGTGSVLNDLSEGLAFKQLNSPAPVSSTKGVHGHSLGAVGALESVLVVQALREQTVLRTLGLNQPDEKIPVQHVQRTEQFELKHVLKSTAGFGGNNAALVFSYA